MADVILSRMARADLVELVEYGAAHFGMDAVDSYQAALDQAFVRLGDYPYSGEARPNFGSGIRCLICRRHRILYRLEEETVQIVRVLHHSRDVPRHIG